MIIRGFSRSHSLLQHLMIELDSDFLNVTRLLIAQQISSSTNVQVVARKHEPGPQTVERLHDFKPFLRGRCHLLALRQR